MTNDFLVSLLGPWAAQLNSGSILLRIGLSVRLSAIIGFERSSKRHSAGLRTFIIISLAATTAAMIELCLDTAFISASVIIGIAMLSLLGTMAVLCATIGIGNYYVAASRADKAIDILYQNDGEFPVPDGNASPSAHAGFQITPETPFETRYFIVRLTAEDAVSAVDLEHIAALDRQTVVSTIEQIVSKGTAKGYVGQYRFGRFENESGGYTLIVIDCFMQLQSAYAVFRVMAAVFVLCAGIVFLLLLVLSKRVTRPFAEN